MSSQDLLLRLHIILRAFVESMLSARLFAQLSFDAGERAVRARLQRLILVGHPIYGHLHAAQRDGDSNCFPLYAATSIATVKPVQVTTSTTLSVERNGVKLCLTDCYN